MNNKTEIKTIDPRGLAHHEKEELIFPSIEDLRKNESLRIIMEFNPVPLVYLLKTRGEFELRYEKEGPDEWILVVKRIAVDKTKKEKLKEMIQKLKKGEISEHTKAQVKELFQVVGAKAIVEMEQELMKQGISHETIRRSLCDIHLEVLRDKLMGQKMEVKPPHEAGNRPPKEVFEIGLEFLRRFADRYHHFKEEFIMFGLLAQKKEGGFFEKNHQIVADMHQIMEGMDGA